MSDAMQAFDRTTPHGGGPVASGSTDAGTRHASPKRIAWIVQMALVACAGLSVVGCGSSKVVVRNGGTAAQPQRSTPRPGKSVTVQRGQTLYRIASDNGISPLDLAMWNAIARPYTIYPGQVLKLYPGGGRATAAGASPRAGTAPPRPATGTPYAGVVAPLASSVAWKWPADGTIITRFANGEPTRQGIDIAGNAGQPVRAAGPGVVVYSGSGLVGYGELVIIKHDDAWLSAYGHNRQRLVNEGQRVTAGQQVAVMGRSGAARDMLHFEIRYNGKPVDPLLYLPSR